MQINFTSRDKARKHAQARKAAGYPAKVVDNGKDAAKRYAVDLKG